MYDLEISLDNNPGALALMGRALGEAKVSVEGGGAWVVQGQGVAHFLFEDGQAAKTALESAGLTVVSCKKALVQRLKQAVPGQLGKLTGLMAEAGVNIEVLYSDHDNQLILVVDDHKAGKIVSDEWMSQL
ncbi:MAG: amino acid-binding protein [Halopseudomonas aestusnigri]